MYKGMLSLTPMIDVHGVEGDVVVLLLYTDWLAVLYLTAGVLHVLSCVSKAVKVPKVKATVKKTKMWGDPLIPNMITTLNLGWIPIYVLVHQVTPIEVLHRMAQSCCQREQMNNNLIRERKALLHSHLNVTVLHNNFQSFYYLKSFHGC